MNPFGGGGGANQGNAGATGGGGAGNTPPTSPSQGNPGGSGIVEIAKNGLTTGGGGSHPSFTWTLDTSNNELEASPVGSTSGNFYFYIGQLGSLSPS